MRTKHFNTPVWVERQLHDDAIKDPGSSPLFSLPFLSTQVLCPWFQVDGSNLRHQTYILERQNGKSAKSSRQLSFSLFVKKAGAFLEVLFIDFCLYLRSWSPTNSTGMVLVIYYYMINYPTLKPEATFITSVSVGQDTEAQVGASVSSHKAAIKVSFGLWFHVKT